MRKLYAGAGKNQAVAVLPQNDRFKTAACSKTRRDQGAYRGQ
jgi:hypothetical protein